MVYSTTRKGCLLWVLIHTPLSLSGHCAKSAIPVYQLSCLYIKGCKFHIYTVPMRMLLVLHPLMRRKWWYFWANYSTSRPEPVQQRYSLTPSGWRYNGERSCEQSFIWDTRLAGVQYLTQKRHVPKTSSWIAPGCISKVGAKRTVHRHLWGPK